MQLFKLRYPVAPEQVLTLLKLSEGQASLEMGTVRLNKDEWVPPEGYSQHLQHELSLILQGSLEVECAGKYSTLTAGEVALIAAGERHRAKATEDTELVWLWFGEGQ